MRAGAHLVLHAFEVDDVRVDGDADRHDEAGDAGEASARGVTRRSSGRITRSACRAPSPLRSEPGDHDEAEQPVEDEHVERDEREADDAGDDAGVELVVAERRRHVLDVQLLRAARAARRS